MPVPVPWLNPVGHKTETKGMKVEWGLDERKARIVRVQKRPPEDGGKSGQNVIYACWKLSKNK